MSLVQNTKADREQLAAQKRAILEKERLEKKEAKERERAEKQALKEKEKAEKQELKDSERIVKQAAKEAVKGAKIQLPDKLVFPETVVLVDKTPKEPKIKTPEEAKNQNVINMFVKKIKAVYKKTKENPEDWEVFEDVVFAMFNEDNTLNMDAVTNLDNIIAEALGENNEPVDEAADEDENKSEN